MLHSQVMVNLRVHWITLRPVNPGERGRSVKNFTSKVGGCLGGPRGST